MIVPQSLDCHHLCAFDLHYRDQAGTDGLPVYENRARAALTLPTPFLRAGEAAFLAQHVEQPRHWMRFDIRACAVQNELHAVAVQLAMSSGVAGISRTSSPK